MAAKKTISIEDHFAAAKSIIDNLSSVIKGKREFLSMLTAVFTAGGHVLIEDLPGLGKTTVAHTLSKLIRKSANGNTPVTFRRIQFTPDLLPYDITGVEVFDPGKRTFKFRPGPVFSNIVLADEINRTTPKVQSALLEVMAENQVTIGNKTYTMDDLFFVIATQNPIEIEGTYRLPAAQLDRFMARLSIGYPGTEAEYAILTQDPSHTVMPKVRPVLSKSAFRKAQKAANRVHCDEKLVRAIIAAGQATREHKAIDLGVSPRGTLMLLKMSKALAFVRERTYVLDQDIIDAAPVVFAHRMKMKQTRVSAAQIAREVVLYEIEKLP